jgi:cardiolipin synthase (CMP-forming)
VIQHVPNLLSLGRLLAVPVEVWLILDGEMTWAFWLFVVAGATDGIDGFIARFWRARSAIGAYLDPVADKVLLVSTFLALAKSGYLPNWLVVMVVSRDIMIVGGVLLLYTLNIAVVMQPSFISKVNTLVQIVLAGGILGIHGLDLEGLAGWIRPVVWLAGATTFASGIVYLLQGWRLLNAPPRKPPAGV